MQRSPVHAKAECPRRIGVLWSGEHLFDGTVETLELLRRKGTFSSVNWKVTQSHHARRQTNCLRHEQQHQESP